MIITQITTILKKIPLKTPFITALRRVDELEFVRVKVQTDIGITTFGEAPATMAITGEDLELITNSILSIRNLLLSKTATNALLILHDTKMGSSAKSALDMAFISLLAQEKNLSMIQYLGGRTRNRLQTDITISLNSSEKMLQDAKVAYNKGMNILKIKLGSDINHAIEITKKIYLALKDVKILLDANQAWNLEESLFFIENIKDIKVELIEQPVKADMINELKIITNSTKIPILADEAVFDLKDVKKVMESGSADMINIKLMKCGGVSKAVEILEYAREKNITCMLGSMLEGPISINTAISLAFAYSDVIKYIDLDSPLLYKTPTKELEFNFDGSYILI